MKSLLIAMLLTSFAVNADLPKELYDSNSFVSLYGDNGFGSAVVISVDAERTYLLTAKHVLVVQNLKIKDSPIRVEKISDKYDLALISVKNQGFKAVKLASASPNRGSKVYLASYPTSLRALMATEGHFQGLTIFGRAVTTPSAGGSSGGAVLACSKQCNLIGILWGSPNERGKPVNYISLIVSIEQIREFLEIDKKTN